MADEEKKEEPDASQEEEQEAGPADPSAGVQEMKEGEYQLHVLVETGKSIFMEGDDTVDPLIKIKWCGKEAQTATKNNVTISTCPKWDEHIFMESGKVSKDEISDSKIEIQIMNYGFFKSESIGYYSISTSSVYSMKSKVNENQKHVFHN